MNRILVYWVWPRFARPCPYTHTIHGMLGNISMTSDSSCDNTLQPQGGWHHCFEVLTKSCPTACMICGLDEQDHSVLIMFKAYHTLHMHPQKMWNVWHHIHCKLLFIQQQKLTLWWHHYCAVLSRSGPTNWVLYDLHEQDTRVSIDFFSCQTLPMKPQKM